MRKLFLIASLTVLACFELSTTAVAQYNNWSVGFRLGEPSGINVRKYFGTNHAFDLNIGTYGGLYGTKRSYRTGEYKSVGLTIQGHYLWHKALTKSESIRGYYGFGGQVNNRRYYPPGSMVITKMPSPWVGRRLLVWKCFRRVSRIRFSWKPVDTSNCYRHPFFSA